MQTAGFALIALFILAYGLISRRIENTMITPPMVFVGFGILICESFTGAFPVDAESPIIHFIAELTLILVLFTDASQIDLRKLIRDHRIPVRLLTIGLRLTILGGTLVAAVTIAGLTFWEGAVLAAILAPTDAALGQAVVSSPRVPERIRQALNVESGLNDGIALPVVLVAICLAAAGNHDETAAHWLQFAAIQVALGPVAGIAVGYIGGWLMTRASKAGWMNHAFQQLAALGLSLLAFAGAELIGGNGFIAAFCAGLTVGNSARGICPCLVEFAEAEGQLLTLITFMIFGALLVPAAIPHADWTVWLYAGLSLTIVRMIPCAISLLGMREGWRTNLFVGWFGPRGIASILFGLIVLEEVELGHGETLFAVVIITVLCSVVLHGLSSVPGAVWYGGAGPTDDAAGGGIPAAPAK